MVIQGVTYLSDFEAKKAIISIAARLEAKGFLVAGDGSLSVRVGPNAVWVTVEGADKAALTQEMLVRVDLSGKQMLSAHPKALAADLAAHLKIYRENEQAQCVLHAYPPCATALGLLGRAVEAAAFSPAVRALGRMQLLPAQSPEAQAEAIGLLCRTDKGVLLQNDGCMTWGKTPTEAAHLVEALDYYCKVKARLGGAPAAASPKACTCGHSATGLCDGSCRQLPAAPAPAACNGDCPHCAAAATCPNCGASVPTAAPAAPLAGVTAMIHPGEALPVLPGQTAPAAAPAAPAPAAPAPQPASPAKPVAAVDVPREDVMAEVIRRTLQTFS